MTGRARLRSVQQVLTARERIRATLAAHRSQREPDPLLRAMLPREQEPEFRRLAKMTQACASQGMAVALIFEHAAGELQLIHFCLTLMGATTLSVRPALAYLVRDDELPDDDPAFDAALGSLVQLVRLVETGETGLPGSSAVDLQAQLTHRLRVEAQHLWQELRAVERIIDEATENLDGDPLVDGVRSRLQFTREAIEAVAEDLADDGAPLALDEPSEDLLATTRDLFWLA